jgi:hypothetical protein
MGHSTGQKVFVHQKSTGKLEPRWRGPFLVKEISSRASITLTYLDGREISGGIGKFHRDDVKPFYERITSHLVDPESPIRPDFTLRVKKKRVRKSHLDSRNHTTDYPHFHSSQDQNPPQISSHPELTSEESPPELPNLIDRIVRRAREIDDLRPKSYR